jgi:hypothetical protein
VTPARFRQLAEMENAAALRALDAGDAVLAREYLLLATLHREVADEMERKGVEALPAARPKSTVEPMMPADHREKLSRSRELDESPAMKAARKAGLPSVRAIAAKLGEDPGFISKCLRGVKPMPTRLAEAFEKATGYPASRWR